MSNQTHQIYFGKSDHSVALCRALRRSFLGKISNHFPVHYPIVYPVDKHKIITLEKCYDPKRCCQFISVERWSEQNPQMMTTIFLWNFLPRLFLLSKNKGKLKDGQLEICMQVTKDTQLRPLPSILEHSIFSVHDGKNSRQQTSSFENRCASPTEIWGDAII